MKKGFYVFMAAIMLLVWSGCSSSSSDALGELEEFVVELQEKGATYTEEDWEKAAERYAEIEEALQEGEYTDEEQVQIGRLKAKCMKVLLRSAAKELKSQMRDAKKQLEGAASEIESFMEELEEEMK